MRDAPSAGQPGCENQIAEHARSSQGVDLPDPGAVPGASTVFSAIYDYFWFLLPYGCLMRCIGIK